MSAEEKDFSPQALLKYCENGEVGPVDNIIANNFGAVDWVLDKVWKKEKERRKKKKKDKEKKKENFVLTRFP